MSTDDTKKIEEALRKSGVLSKLESMTKAAIVRQLRDEGAGELGQTPELKQVVSTTHGKVALAMAAELLEYCGLNFTLSTLNDEVGTDCRMPAEAIHKEVGIPKGATKMPSLLFVLEAAGKDDDEPPAPAPKSSAAPPVSNNIPPTSPPKNPTTKQPTPAPAPAPIPKTATKIDEDPYSSFEEDNF
eukprot:PhF_6_TR38716/c0_g1_i1/m.57946/K16546/FGFR10P; FGFR1 oncogene partner